MKFAIAVALLAGAEMAHAQDMPPCVKCTAHPKDCDEVAAAMAAPDGCASECDGVTQISLRHAFGCPIPLPACVKCTAPPQNCEEMEVALKYEGCAGKCNGEAKSFLRNYFFANKQCESPHENGPKDKDGVPCNQNSSPKPCTHWPVDCSDLEDNFMKEGECTSDCPDEYNQKVRDEAGDRLGFAPCPAPTDEPCPPPPPCGEIPSFPCNKCTKWPEDCEEVKQYMGKGGCTEACAGTHHGYCIWKEAMKQQGKSGDCLKHMPEIDGCIEPSEDAGSTLAVAPLAVAAAAVLALQLQ